MTVCSGPGLAAQAQAGNLSSSHVFNPTCTRVTDFMLLGFVCQQQQHRGLSLSQARETHSRHVLPFLPSTCMYGAAVWIGLGQLQQIDSTAPLGKQAAATVTNSCALHPVCVQEDGICGPKASLFMGRLGGQ